jgi:eukaryotic-like serine/threonine-protein kinase
MSRVQPLAPPLLDRMVTRCLAKDPDDRWQSARDLRTALGWTGETTPTMSRRAASPARWVVTVVVLLAAGGALGWFGASVRAPFALPRALSLEIGPPAGGELVLSIGGGGSAISPDGTTVSFVAKVEGVSRLWVRPLDSITSQELPDTDDAQYPFWSPDGRSLGYFAHGYLRRIDVFGGASTILTPVSNPRGGSWSEDGTIVFSEGIGPLQRISAFGGTRSSLTTLAPAEVSHRWPRFLPDGRTLFFFVQGDRTGVYLTALDRDGEKQRVGDASVDAAYVPPRGTWPGYVLMVQGDSLVAQPFDIDSMRMAGPAVAIPGAGNALTFTGASRSNLSVANDGTVVYAAGSNRYQMTWFGMDGALVRNVGVPDRYVGLRISPDGTEALAFVDDSVGNRDIWRLELTSGVRSRVTSDNKGHFGTWSPDGQRIAFSGLTRQTLFEKSASGDTGDRRLLRSDYSMIPSDWSRDGRFLLYAQASPGQGSDVWALSIEGASKATPILQSPAAEIQGGFSPNGKLVN